MGRALAEHDPALWSRCAQVWACLGLLHHGTEEPWPGSSRRRVLVELAVAGADGITEAALFALVTYAWVDPAARPDVAGFMARRLSDIVESDRAGTAAIAWSVAQLALATPDLDPVARRLAADVIRAEEDYAVRLIPRQRNGAGRRLLNWLTGRCAP
jgi:hypothetical protein